MRLNGGEFNYVAYLFADENGVSIKVAVYAGVDKVDLVETREYGHCCLITATQRILDRLDSENRTFAKITSKNRLERERVNTVALREAVINAIVHNDYSQGDTPVFEIFSDRFTITSYGGLPEGLTPERFFKGYTKTRNRELMKIFHDLDLVEEIGSGMERILAVYTSDNFELDGYFIRVTFKFENIGSNEPINEPINLVFESIKANLQISREQIAKQTGMSLSTVKRSIKTLKEQGKLKGKTSNKKGTWELIE